MSKLRNYCFTLHAETLPTLEFPEDDVRYAIWQTEKCPETGRLHYQGYLELAKPMRIVAVKNLLPQLEGAHFEPRRGTRDQARDYCRKAETKVDGPWEHGAFGAGGQGCHTDLLAVKEAIDSGATDLEIAEAHFGSYCRFHRAFTNYRRLKQTAKDWKTEVYVLYGPPGTGKSRYCQDNSRNAYWKQIDKWWCGYEDHADVVLDDFYGWLPWNVLLRISDRYPVLVETKGGNVNWQARRLFITTNTLPHLWYPKMSSVFPAFVRRVEKWFWLPEIDVLHEFSDYDKFRYAVEHNKPPLPRVTYRLDEDDDGPRSPELVFIE